MVETPGCGSATAFIAKAPCAPWRCIPVTLVPCTVARTAACTAARTASPSCAAARGSYRTSIIYRWSKEFLEAGKKRLAGDTARAATSDEVKELRREAGALKEVVAELTRVEAGCSPASTVAKR